MSGRAECSRSALEATRRLRTALAQDLNRLVGQLRSNGLEDCPHTLLDIKDKVCNVLTTRKS